MNSILILEALRNEGLERARELCEEGENGVVLEETKGEEKEQEEGAEVVGMEKQGQQQEQNGQEQQEQQDEKQEKESPEPLPIEQGQEEKPKPKKEDEKPEMLSYVKPKCYEFVKLCVENKEPVLLTGEAGTGKNELCKNLAKELDLNFYFCNAVIDPFQLTGYGNAQGEYVKSQFYDFCINGGLFMFDEVDASDPQATVVFNSAIDNGYFDFPVVGRVNLNPNCRFIACANTKGQGASMRYVGRNKLDQAFCDRFTLVQTNYERKVEMKIANKNVELVNFVEDFRNACEKCGVDIVVGYRAIRRITKLERKDNLEMVLKSCLTKHLEKDDIRLIYNTMKFANDKYYNAFEKAWRLK